MRSRIIAIILGLLAALGLLLCAERWVEREEALSWQVISDPPGIKFTFDIGKISAGRGWLPQREIPSPLPERKRVVSLGDSLTFGLHNVPSKAWPAIAGTLVGETRVEVVNLGVVGWDAGQVATLLEGEVEALKPDLVVWGTFENDQYPTHIMQGRYPLRYIYVENDVPEAARVLPPGLTRLLLRHSAVFRGIQGAIYARRVRDDREKGPIGWYQDQVARFTAWSEKTGIPLMVLTIPGHHVHDQKACVALDTGGADACRNHLTDYQTITDTVARSGLPWVDGLLAYKSGGRPCYPNEIAPTDMTHPGAEGHRLLAQAVAPVIARLLALEGPAPPPEPAPRPRHSLHGNP